jgi:ribosomal protein S27AE
MASGRVLQMLLQHQGPSLPPAVVLREMSRKKCEQGHWFAPTDNYITAAGKRRCPKCRRESALAYHQQKLREGEEWARRNRVWVLRSTDGAG